MELSPHDVVFSREGALLGVAVRIPESRKFCLGQRMMVFRPAEDVCDQYFENYLNSQPFQSQYAPKINGTASPHLNIGDIRGFAIPLPPPSEQRHIASETERRLSAMSQLEKMVEINLVRAERLRQAILRRAFEGKLVGQEAGDEAARIVA